MIKILFEINKSLNSKKGEEEEQFEETNFDCLTENNKVRLKLSNYEPMLFQEFKDFFYKQDFFNNENEQFLMSIKSKIFLLENCKKDILDLFEKKIYF